MLPTILICLGLAAMLGGALFVLVRDRRQGKSSCGCGCSSCPMGGMCHSTQTEDLPHSEDTK